MIPSSFKDKTREEKMHQMSKLLCANMATTVTARTYTTCRIVMQILSFLSQVHLFSQTKKLILGGRVLPVPSVRTAHILHRASFNNIIFLSSPTSGTNISTSITDQIHVLLTELFSFLANCFQHYRILHGSAENCFKRLQNRIKD